MTQQALTTDNPFSRLYKGIKGLFVEDKQFQAMFKPGNQVWFDTSRDELKEKITTADLPEFMFAPRGGPINLFHTSSSVKIDLSYQLIVTTGDMRVHDYVHPISWMLLCASLTWLTKLSETAKWKDESFCKALKVGGASISDSNDGRNRTINGWSAVWDLTAECVFTRSKISFSEFSNDGT